MFMQKRLINLQNGLKSAGLDAILITGSINRSYITGFVGTAGYGLVTLEDAFLFTDFRYTEQAKNQAKAFDVIEFKSDPFQTINSVIKEKNIQKLGFEDKVMAYAQFKNMTGKIVVEKLEPAGDLIEKLRQIKDTQEIKKIKEAARITDSAFEHIIDYIRVGMTEYQVALELEIFMKKNGAKGLSFDTIAASGVRSSMPHGVASPKCIEFGDLLTLDFGCVFEGYCSDMTRTIGVGRLDDDQKRIYYIVLEAQKAALQSINKGRTGSEIDKVARDIVTRYGYGENFGHGLGHGVGMEIHEEPRLSPTSQEELIPGMVVTVEPGIYIQDFGGVRIEDMVVLTDEGIYNFTSSKKELLII